MSCVSYASPWHGQAHSCSLPLTIEDNGVPQQHQDAQPHPEVVDLQPMDACQLFGRVQKQQAQQAASNAQLPQMLSGVLTSDKIRPWLNTLCLFIGRQPHA